MQVGWMSPQSTQRFALAYKLCYYIKKKVKKRHWHGLKIQNKEEKMLLREKKKKKIWKMLK